MDLPERCSCGSVKGEVIRTRVEDEKGRLLAEVECSGCRKRILIPDKNEEAIRKVAGEKYRPIWFYNSETGEMVHWTRKRKKL